MIFILLDLLNYLPMVCFGYNFHFALSHLLITNLCPIIYFKNTFILINRSCCFEIIDSGFIWLLNVNSIFNYSTFQSISYIRITRSQTLTFLGHNLRWQVTPFIWITAPIGHQVLQTGRQIRWMDLKKLNQINTIESLSYFLFNSKPNWRFGLKWKLISLVVSVQWQKT